MSRTESGTDAAAATLAEFLDAHPRIAVLTGAGVSTASGIPDYRDERGEWKHSRPVMFDDFRRDEAMRRRYWARSFIGWPRFSEAAPNAAHHALADLQRHVEITGLITQNVDRLHQRAGSTRVIDLHGRLDRVVCLECRGSMRRDTLQSALSERNPRFVATASRLRPDGDVELDPSLYRRFEPIDCAACGGTIKPDVVFFGESVPRERVTAAREALASADALLVVGSSLMVFSGYRFARQAASEGKPVVILNRGRTRADDLAHLHLVSDCGPTLSASLEILATRTGANGGREDQARSRL